MNANKRVRKGLSSQDAVAAFIKAEAHYSGVKVKVLSKAGFGKKTNDLVVSYGGVKFSVEVKGTSGNRPITMFDKSVRRRRVPPEVDRIAVALAEDVSVGGYRLRVALSQAGYDVSFLGIIDFYRDKLDPTVGLAEDAGSASSGKLPRDLTSRGKKSTDEARKMVLEALRSGEDSYFAVHDKTTDDVAFWHTGYGPNPLEAPPFPKIRAVQLDTYGGASLGATRIGFKVSL